MNSMKLIIPLHLISWKKTSNNAVTWQRQSQFTPKMKANAVPRFLSSLVSSLVWLWHCGVTALFEVFFHEIKRNGMTSFMEFMSFYLFRVKPSESPPRYRKKSPSPTPSPPRRKRSRTISISSGSNSSDYRPKRRKKPPTPSSSSSSSESPDRRKRLTSSSESSPSPRRSRSRSRQPRRRMKVVKKTRYRRRSSSSSSSSSSTGSSVSTYSSSRWSMWHLSKILPILQWIFLLPHLP